MNRWIIWGIIALKMGKALKIHKIDLIWSLSTSTSVFVLSLPGYPHNWIITCYFLISRWQHLILDANAEIGSCQIVQWLRIALPVWPSQRDVSRPFHLRPGTDPVPELHTLLNVEGNTKSRQLELHILFMYVPHFSFMITSSSTTVKRTKQTLKWKE